MDKVKLGTYLKFGGLGVSVIFFMLFYATPYWEMPRDGILLFLMAVSAVASFLGASIESGAKTAPESEKATVDSFQDFVALLGPAAKDAFRLDNYGKLPERFALHSFTVRTTKSGYEVLALADEVATRVQPAGQKIRRDDKITTDNGYVADYLLRGLRGTGVKAQFLVEYEEPANPTAPGLVTLQVGEFIENTWALFGLIPIPFLPKTSDALNPFRNFSTVLQRELLAAAPSSPPGTSPQLPSATPSPSPAVSSSSPIVPSPSPAVSSSPPTVPSSPPIVPSPSPAVSSSPPELSQRPIQSHAAWSSWNAEPVQEPPKPVQEPPKEELRAEVSVLPEPSPPPPSSEDQLAVEQLAVEQLAGEPTSAAPWAGTGALPGPPPPPPPPPSEDQLAAEPTSAEPTSGEPTSAEPWAGTGALPGPPPPPPPPPSEDQLAAEPWAGTGALPGPPPPPPPPLA